MSVLKNALIHAAIAWLGNNSLNSGAVIQRESLQQSTNTTPLIFVLSPGVDPTAPLLASFLLLSFSPPLLHY